MAKTSGKKQFVCGECGAVSRKWLGQCPGCEAWNSLTERSPVRNTARTASSVSPVALSEIETDSSTRTSTGDKGLDRVLGGGVLRGSVTLVGGEPGIGKSTLLLQIARDMSTVGDVLYVSGEESASQIAHRAARIGAINSSISVLSETDAETIAQQIEASRPVIAIIDSIQTTRIADAGAAGSISQVRESATLLTGLAKRTGIPIMIIGHVTKDGSIAGPRTLEHIVDTVIYFEGERSRQFRVLRATKNRFGNVNEIAIFEMASDGLIEVENPSELMLSERSREAGSSVVATIEGTRPLLVEIQALVSSTHYPSPRRMATGLDTNRVSRIIAVLEKKCRIDFSGHDVFVNVTGGLDLDEPALDLGIAAALISSRNGVPIADDIVLYGEIGLLGEVRSVAHSHLRAKEAEALGFKRMIIPAGNARDETPHGIRIRHVGSVDQMLDAIG